MSVLLDQRPGPIALQRRRSPSVLRLTVLFSTFAGTAIAVALVVSIGLGDIAHAIAGAGWGVLAVIAFHFIQMAFSAEAWRSVLPYSPRSGILRFIGLRWIREAVNALLPVAQIGGEFVGARLLALRRVPLDAAAASVTVDLTMEMISQAIFTLLGIGLLLLIRPPDEQVTQWMIGISAVATAVVIAFALTQRLGLFRLVERGLVKLAGTMGWSGLGEISGLHEAIVGLYRKRRLLCVSCGYHLISWLFGGIEVVLALYVLGVAVDFREGLVIESLGQAMRTIGFGIPASIGVQEGGYILACALLGVGPQAAIELSLLKRIREVALGVPGLIAWYIIEGNRLVGGRAASRTERTPLTSLSP